MSKFLFAQANEACSIALFARYPVKILHIPYAKDLGFDGREIICQCNTLICAGMNRQRPKYTSTDNELAALTDVNIRTAYGNVKMLIYLIGSGNQIIK